MSWTDLASRLRSRYPDDWERRYQSYKDGSNSDLQAWRAIGGQAFVPDAAELKPTRFPARDLRIRAAHRSGVPVILLAERFDLGVSAIQKIVATPYRGASR